MIKSFLLNIKEGGMLPLSRIRNQNHYANLVAMVASIPFFLYGCEIIMVHSEDAIMEDLKLNGHRSQLHFYVTYMSRGPLIGGALFAGVISNYIGRRYTIGIGGGIYTVGVLVVSIASNFILSIFGRVFTGAGIGIGLVIGPIFIAEIAPASKRGFLSSFPQVLMALGMLVVNMSELSHMTWRLTLGLTSVPSALLSVLTLLPKSVIPDSPCWLVTLGEIDDATNLLKRCGVSDDEANDRIMKLKRDTAGNSTMIRGFWQHASSFPWVRRRWYATAGLLVAQDMACLQLALLYLPAILANNNHSSLTLYLIVSVALSFLQLVCTLAPTFFLDSLGRRRLLLVSIAGVGLLLGGFGGTLLVDARQLIGPTPLLVLYSIEFVGMVGFGSIGLGAVPWIFGPESLPLPVRAPAIGFSVATMFGVSLILRLKIPPYYSSYDMAGFGFFLSCGAMMFAFVLCYLFFRDRTSNILENKDCMRSLRISECMRICEWMKSVYYKSENVKLPNIVFLFSSLFNNYEFLPNS